MYRQTQSGVDIPSCKRQTWSMQDGAPHAAVSNRTDMPQNTERETSNPSIGPMQQTSSKVDARAPDSASVDDEDTGSVEAASDNDNDSVNSGRKLNGNSNGNRSQHFAQSNVLQGISSTNAIQQDTGISEESREQIFATLYGQCMGDAIGLLSEFMSRNDASHCYGRIEELEFRHKQIAEDGHRSQWKEGDWTDDTDQLILIMQSIVDKDGEIDPVHFAEKLYTWMKEGFRELGDREGIGIGRTTNKTLNHPEFLIHPCKAAEIIWQNGNRDLAPNGGVMRTAILGIHDWWDVDKVEQNAVAICKVTHRDPRCQASAVAVSAAISLMLQNKYFDGIEYDLPSIVADVFKRGSKHLEREPIERLKFSLECEDLQELDLGGQKSIGYTFKCLGAGFWALKQKDFRAALQQIVLSGGDADTNGAVAGALLGCKLRNRCVLPRSWTEFPHKLWLDDQIERYLVVLSKRRQLHLLCET